MRHLRIIFRRLSERVVLRRSLPRGVGGGRIFTSPSSALSFWKPGRIREFELFDFLKEFVSEGDSVWDIGANVGLFGISAAHLAGREGAVLCVEADGWLCTLLRRSGGVVPETDAVVEVLSAAVADQVSVSKFNIARSGRSVNFLSGLPEIPLTGGVRESYHVMTVTLDWLLDYYRPPDVLKLDIEGAELMALRGAEKILSTVRPVIHLEVYSSIAEEVSGLLSKAGYAIYDADAPVDQRGPIEVPSYNTLAIPAERLEDPKRGRVARRSR